MTQAELKDIRVKTEELCRLGEYILEVESTAERMTTLLNGMPRSSTCRSALEENAIRLAEARERYARLTDELFWKRTEALTAIIEGVSDSSGRKILIARYLDFKGWRAIAREFGYSMKHTLRKHKAALRELESVPT